MGRPAGVSEPQMNVWDTEINSLQLPNKQIFFLISVDKNDRKLSENPLKRKNNSTTCAANMMFGQKR